MFEQVISETVNIEYTSTFNIQEEQILTIQVKLNVRKFGWMFSVCKIDQMFQLVQYSRAK